MVTGVLAVCIATVILISPIRRSLSRRQAITAFILYDADENRLLAVPEYEYATELARYVEYGCAKSPQIASIWSGSRLDADDGPEHARPVQRAGTLVADATEYFLLIALCHHLRDVFARITVPESERQLVNLNSVPEALLNNRFFQLISMDPASRQPSDTVRAALGRSGDLFNLFDFVVPVRGELQAPGGGVIGLSAPRFKLEFHTRFDGYTYRLPREFTRLYLGIADDRHLQAYEVEISIHAQLRWSSFLSGRGLEYHAWLDSLIASIEEQASASQFFQRMNWPFIVALLKSFDHARSGDEPVALAGPAPDAQSTSPPPREHLLRRVLTDVLRMLSRPSPPT